MLHAPGGPCLAGWLAAFTAAIIESSRKRAIVTVQRRARPSVRLAAHYIGARARS